MPTVSTYSIYWLAVVVAALFVICLAGLIWSLFRLQQVKRQARKQLEDSLNRSRAVMRGQLSESFAPLLPGFPFHFKDARFLGQPIDYLVFDGLSHDDGKAEISVWFVEIKTGKSALSDREKAVKAAVEAGRVRWMTLRLDDAGTLHEL